MKKTSDSSDQRTRTRLTDEMLEVLLEKKQTNPGPLTQSGGYGPNPPGSGAAFLNGHGVLWNE